MAYIRKEDKAIIAELMKPILKKYKVKATLSISNNSTIYLNVKSSPIDFIGIFNENVVKEDFHTNYKIDNIQINPYWFDSHFKGHEIALSFLKEAHDALRGADWFDNSDIQSDYFNTKYYYYINVGQWNKPYILVA